MRHDEELIRRGLERIATPGDPSGVVERVLVRAARRRVLHRVGSVVLALAVVGGTILGTYGLFQAFRPVSDRATTGLRTPVSEPSIGPSPSSEPVHTLAGVSTPVCRVSSVEGDFFGDGVPDRAYVFSKVDDTGGCPDPQGFALIGIQPNMLGDTQVVDIPIECPATCRAFAAADMDGDARAELAVMANEGGSAGTQILSVFRVTRGDAAGSEGPVMIEKIQMEAPEGSFEPASMGGDLAASQDDPCIANEARQAVDIVLDTAMLERYRLWYRSNTSGVKSGQDLADLIRLASIAAAEGLAQTDIETIFDPSFSWGLNDPNGGARLLRFLIRNPDLIPEVLVFHRSFRPDASDPYHRLNPGAQHQTALLRESPELHAAYTLMARGNDPLSSFWTNEGNLIPLASIAGESTRLGRQAAYVLRTMRQGLQQLPDRNYFFKGGRYEGPGSVVSLSPDLAEFVRSWQGTAVRQAESSCVGSASSTIG